MRKSIFSFCYRLIRFITTKILYIFQWLLLKPLDLEPAVIFGDKNLALLSRMTPFVFNYRIPAGIEVELYDLKFPSPLTGASFKSETDILGIWLTMGLGSVTLKTIMEGIRTGNERPRLQEVNTAGNSGFLNSMGLPGPGIDAFAETIADSKLWDYGRPLGISVGGDSGAEYVANIQKFLHALKEKDNYFLELNISCPNTENGRTLADDPDQLDTVLQEIRNMTPRVIAVKVSPDSELDLLSTIGEIAGSCPQTFINAGNTQYKTVSDAGVEKKNFSMPGGGVSGPAIFPSTLKMVHLFSSRGMPVMATGGISTIEHVKAVKDEGAVLFGMATALVLDPFCIPNINSML